MVSVLVEDLAPETSEFFARRARRTGTESVAEQVRHELVTLAREPAPVDEVVAFVEQNHERRPVPDVDPDALVLQQSYRLPEDVWSVLCRRAAVAGVPVSVYVHDELVGVSRRGSIDDIMWEFGEYKDAHPDSDVDLEAILEATRYARGLD
jgi:hypothetical protein